MIPSPSWAATLRTRKLVVRAHLPYAQEVHIAEGNLLMERIPNTDLFEWHGKIAQVPERYRLIWRDSDHHEHISYDPYCFPPQIPDFDLYLFGEGKHWHSYRFLGAHPHQVDNVAGVLFAVWAPSAERVSVVGNFNRWDGRIHPMRVRGGSGVWELFIPNLCPGDLYKFELRNRHSGAILLKSDPYGQHFELRPSTATIVTKPSAYAWRDTEWLDKRKSSDWLHQSMSVYEIHWDRGGVARKASF
jgi:1,4-alpha-glucan branching enzyme